MHAVWPRQPARIPSVQIGALALAAVIAFGLCWGCALVPGRPPDPEARRLHAEALARAGGFRLAPVARVIAESDGPSELPVAAWIKPGRERGCVRVYLEGDGLAWQTRHRISDDPTPRDPIGLRLALADPSDATLIYLARPCQYGGAETSPCRPSLWTTARYGEEILQATNARLDALINALEAKHVTLVGFSGGGVVAALLAARRDDVNRLVTIAAPLDLGAWTRTQGVTPLVLSLSPMDELDVLRDLSQDHFVGLVDERVPASIGVGFHRALGPDAPSRLHRIDHVGHFDWPARWGALLDRLEPLCREPGEGSGLDAPPCPNNGRCSRPPR